MDGEWSKKQFVLLLIAWSFVIERSCKDPQSGVTSSAEVDVE
jgi:hypothetical protein